MKKPVVIAQSADPWIAGMERLRDMGSVPRLDQPPKATFPGAKRSAMSAAAKARWEDPHARARLLQRKNDPEYRRKIAEAMKASWAARKKVAN